MACRGAVTAALAPTPAANALEPEANDGHLWRMDWLSSFLSGLEFWHWLALGLLLLLLELVTGSTYLLWPAVAAWLTGLLVMALPIGWPVQLAIFAVAVLVLLMFGRPLARNRLLSGGDSALNERGLQLEGARGVASSGFEGGVGRVRLGDSEWRAESEDAIASGDAVDIVRVEGSTLRVKRRGS